MAGRIVILNVLLFSVTGCSQRVDPYDQAMKRLVNEQKQLDRIQTQIDQVKKEFHDEAAELRKSLDEVAADELMPIQFKEKFAKANSELLKV